jgi:hypothetical protein
MLEREQGMIPGPEVTSPPIPRPEFMKPVPVVSNQRRPKIRVDRREQQDQHQHHLQQLPRMKQPANKIWETKKKITVQGGTLRTISFKSPDVQRVQVHLSTQGRPLDADIRLWDGPDNNPNKIRVYSENGHDLPFKAVLETPGLQNTLAIRNAGFLEFPMAAHVEAESNGDPTPIALRPFLESHATVSEPRVIQGGAARTFPFDMHVKSIKVALRTDGRPLKARVELLQGPDNKKQVIELYAEDGRARPFVAVIETPQKGSVVRVVNKGEMEFPLTASVEAHDINHEKAIAGFEPVIGGVDRSQVYRVGQW